MKTATWGTHIFTYMANKFSRKLECKNKFESKCPICGITWKQLSDAYWRNEKVIKNCNDYIIKSIIE